MTRHQIAFDANLRVTVRVTVSASTPKATFLAAEEALRAALMEADLGYVPIAGIKVDGVLESIHITEATMNADPESFSIDGDNLAEGEMAFCRNDDCGELNTDGEGWEGECGNCADRTYAKEGLQ